ncbi:nuclear transport factor 2 family protein [Natrarchaeobaculum sulfurireducens]|uniref:Ketosteroid isomerase-related protein n=1 Tax=Natrarchaeobaculum sulfurireducens TaxID=2044521 RepID=A0A346PAR4_9EURY|nr:nuclear transport factor 2 family protein [Natrarchaeobaculum sulfurireducens]AXR76609.1 Ketosteroid isomerase-related protein [Natrarchaeobaculum sulfurireducens]
MEAAATVRRYYEALDDHDYGTLESLLAPEFVQRRPDRTFEDRTAFVAFMRDGRPNPDTTHELEAVVAEGDRVAARGRVLESETELFAFADFFTLEDGLIVRLETYAR